VYPLFSEHGKVIKAEYMGKDGKSRREHVPDARGIRFSLTLGLDVSVFLKKIGRGCSEYESKFQSWNELFLKTSDEMAEMGIPSQKRKYILGWREWFKYYAIIN
jgi:hypothetical protein